MPIINRQYLGPVYPNRPRLSLKNFGRDAEVQNIHRDFEALQLEMMDSSTAFIDGDDPLAGWTRSHATISPAVMKRLLSLDPMFLVTEG